MATTNMPTRSATDDDVMPDEDPSEVTTLFLHRVSAWKSACSYLEDYVTATEKAQSSHTKDYEKVLKTVNHPLKEGEHFDQNAGGVSGLFESIRANTQGIAQSHTETAKAIKSTVLPIFERLSTELKHKTKEISKSAGKGSKSVDKARSASQKHIEKLGQHTAAFGTPSGKIAANDDPYVLQRGIYHRLNTQVTEENNNRQDLLAVQSSFAQFEAHVVQTFQDGLVQFDQIMARQADQSRQIYGDMASNARAIAPDHEWKGFLTRNNQMLIDPSDPPRSVETMGFANQDHKATQPIIAGSLERKSKILKKYEAGFYAVTPSKFLHEFKTNDNFARDPVPENSLYLPDCIVGALDGAKFAVKGKDASKGSISSKLSMSHEYQFQAHTPADAQKWYEAIFALAGQKSEEIPDADDLKSPSRQGSNNLETHGAPVAAGAGAGAGTTATDTGAGAGAGTGVDPAAQTTAAPTAAASGWTTSAPPAQSAAIERAIYQSRTQAPPRIGMGQ